MFIQRWLDFCIIPPCQPLWDDKEHALPEPGSSALTEAVGGVKGSKWRESGVCFPAPRRAPRRAPHHAPRSTCSHWVRLLMFCLIEIESDFSQLGHKGNLLRCVQLGFISKVNVMRTRSSIFRKVYSKGLQAQKINGMIRNNKQLIGVKRFGFKFRFYHQRRECSLLLGVLSFRIYKIETVISILQGYKKVDGKNM